MVALMMINFFINLERVAILTVSEAAPVQMHIQCQTGHYQKLDRSLFFIDYSQTFDII